MEYTGERFLPEVTGGIALEHRHRYLLAALYARDKDVLDIASGEGYGSAILANVARSVTGVDISAEAAAHAQKKYTAHNLRFLQGSAAAIPLPDASVDMVVSFETIEHHDQHEEMLREIKRVLRPGGLLCMSSPDRYEYSVAPDFHNEYHVKELTLEEFDALLGSHFTHHVLTGQRVVYGSLIGARDGVSRFASWREGSALQSHTMGVPHAVYLIALASDEALPVAVSSLLEDSVEASAPYLSMQGERDFALGIVNDLQQHVAELRRIGEEGAIHAEDLERQLRDRTKQASDLESQLGEKANHALSLETRLREQADYARALENQLNEQTNQAREQARTIEIQVNEQADRARWFEQELNAMLVSRSWRITKPLRAVMGLARRLCSRAPAAVPESPAEPSGGEDLPVTTPQNNCIQARVAAYKAGAELIPAEARDVRIHVAGAGNHFFLEIAALIQSGFTDAGLRATVAVADTFEDCTAQTGADLHLIIAPHEFFHFIPQAVTWPHTAGQIWMLNTEQGHTPWFDSARAAFGRADLILDMDCEMADNLARTGLRAEHLPLGFSPGCRLFDGLAPIELNDATRGIPRRIREWMDQDDPLAASLSERPLDCCFFGANTERRTAFFARNAALFAKLQSYLRLKPLTGPLRVGVTSPLSTECTSSIVRRSKVSLNIHQSGHSYFEWHRVVLQGIWQGSLVLSEPCTAAWPFRPNREYIVADLDHLADTLEYLLCSEEGMALAERVRRQARVTLTENCRMGDRLRELLHLYSCGQEGRQ